VTGSPSVADELEISALLSRYARGVDTKDWDLYRSVFTDDAVIDYSANGIPAGSREEIVEFMRETFSAGVTMSMHYITNIEVAVDGGQERSDPGNGVGDAATVRAMFYNPTKLAWLDDMSFFGGYYHHELVRTADGWRSRNLREDAVWSVNSPMKDQPSAL
jgi:hypothetical protein